MRSRGINTPRTFVHSTVPAKSGHGPTTKEEDRAQDEHTKAHRDTEAECMRANVTHGSKFRVAVLEDLSRQTSRE